MRIVERPSPNHQLRTDQPVDILVLHYTELPLKESLDILSDDKREGSNYFDGQSSLYGIVALKTKVQRGPVVWFESLRRSPLEFSAQVTLDAVKV